MRVLLAIVLCPALLGDAVMANTTVGEVEPAPRLYFMELFEG